MLKAQHNYVVVMVDEAREVEGPHGLILPENAKPVQTTGIVTSVGPYVRTEGIVEGARVVFPPYGVGEPVKFEGRDYIVLLDHALLGVIDGD